MQYLKAFSVIVAITKNRGIGIQGQMGWRLKQEMQQFKITTSTTTHPTKQNAVIMGRKTWESLQGRALPSRINIIITRQPTFVQLKENCHAFGSLDTALEFLSKKKVDKIFVIGGGEIYAQALKHKMCTELLVTQLLEDRKSDTFFPAIPPVFECVFVSAVQTELDMIEKQAISYQYQRWLRVESNHVKMVNIVETIIRWCESCWTCLFGNMYAL